MGQFAFTARGSSFETSAPQESGAGASPTDTASEAAVVADSETRRVLSILRLALDRLPE